jgi:hypothetical protein
MLILLLCILKKKRCGSSGPGPYGYKVEIVIQNISTVKPRTGKDGIVFMGFEIRQVFGRVEMQLLSNYCGVL